MTIKIRSKIGSIRAKHLTQLNIEKHKSDAREYVCDINLKLPFTDIVSDDGDKIKDSLYVGRVTLDEIELLIKEFERLYKIIKKAENNNVTDCCNINTKIIAQHCYDSNYKKYIRTDEEKSH